MERLVLIALLGCLAVAGCATAPGSPPTGTAGDTPTVTDSTASPTPTAGSPSTATREQENVTVEYLVRAGSIPSEFESVIVTFDVAFVENLGEIEECTGTVMASRYDPTPTPLPTPTGDCRTVEEITVDLTELDGTHSLGNFTVPRRYGTEHALVVRDVVPTYANGTRVERIHDTDFRGVVTFGSGRFGLRVGVTGVSANNRWRYGVFGVPFDPGE